MFEKLQELRERALARLAAVKTASELEEWRVVFLGRSGEMTAILRSLKDLPIAERPAMGQKSNQVKVALENAYAEHKERIITSKKATSASDLDTSLDGMPASLGAYHISTITMNKILGIFGDMGFQAIEGPEVEEETYNFDKLNIRPDHPARDLMDTIWLNDAIGGTARLLRTHTSPMQIRAMQNTAPPVRVVSSGKCFRQEATDPSHDWQFHQVEGIAIGADITFANMKWVLEQFVKRFFGSARKTRFRCDYFPFVEPGVDVSIDCFVCAGGGCRLCKQTGWIEIMGAGMTHPNVLRGVGYDPNKVSGFAFGMGPERIAMLSHGIEDIRLFFENDLRFLSQFGGMGRG